MQTPITVFRPDINGLRAIAVIAVVLYHFGVGGFSGGFVGVDIFFVISGFLMTGIIYRQMDSGKFTFTDFYLARAKRIIPALGVLCLILLAVGWFLLIPSDYKELGKHVASSIGFLSNMVYWRGAGYFDTASHDKWLLHTWSLSVEWQFYMVYPLVIVAVRKLFSFNGARLALTALAATSFALCLYASAHYPNTAFYTLPTRAWEMIIGGLICLFPVQIKEPHKKYAGMIGLIMIAVSVYYFDASDIWPGWLALIPVLGTALLVCANDQNSFVTNNKFADMIGEASYSIYLWHWPVVVLIGYYSLEGDGLVGAVGIAISVLLGLASLYLIEKPTRSIRMPRSQVLHATCYAALILVIGVSASLIFLNRGVESRVSNMVVDADRERINKNPASKDCFVTSGVGSPKCIFGDADKPVGVIVIGDSHADAIVSAVTEAAGAERSTMYLGYVSCMTIPGMRLQNMPENYQCGEFVSRQIEMLSKTLIGVPLVVTNRSSVYVLGHNEREPFYHGPLMYFSEPGPLTDSYKDDFRKRYVSSVCEFAKHRPVYVTKPIPEIGVDVPRKIARDALRLGRSDDISISLDSYRERNAFVLSVMEDAVKTCGVHLLDPEPALCDESACYGSINGKPLYWDDNHLSESGNKLLVPMFQQIWD